VVAFNATPEQIFELLMNSEKHSQFTDSDCNISPKVGGKFFAYDGYIDGKNLELIPGKKIVQKWRASDWPRGHYSLVTFELKKSPEGTKLIFTQENVPSKFLDDIDKGWFEHYWDKMTKYLEK